MVMVVGTAQMSAGTRTMMEREQNQVYPTVKSTYRGASGPAKYLSVKITMPTVRGSEIIQNTHISLSLSATFSGFRDSKFGEWKEKLKK